MNILEGVLKSLLPVLVTLGLGMLAGRTGLLDEAGAGTLKKVVSRITLPFVIFQAFLTADYGTDMAVVFLVVAALCLATFAAGFLIRKRASGVSQLLPFTVSGYEMGMLGYPLFMILAGAPYMGYMAKVDLGQVLFVFSLYLFMLRRLTGEEKGLKGALLDIAKNPVMVALALGLILGVTGLAGLIMASPLGAQITSVTSFVGAPTAALILLAIGYDFKPKPALLGPVMKALLIRLALNAVFGGLAILLLFLILPFDPWLLLAMLTMLILPAPFVLPVYSQNESEKEFVSMYLSTSTMVTILLFAVLLVLKPLITGA
ncbi:MAG: AEC family transporter [Eubacteriales bacterium]|nr:AEC family transporter [Eubacteriales bacterium]